MIPSFKDYIHINESNISKIMCGLKRNIHDYSYDYIKEKFIEKKYEYLGDLEIFENLNNREYKCDEIVNSVPNDIIDILIKYYKIDDYLRESPEIYPTIAFKFSDDNEERFREILSKPYIDKITACNREIQYGSDRLYLVLWNDDYKYFYFILLPSSKNVEGIYGFVELWLKIRTTGIDTVRDEVEKIKIKGEKR